MKNTDNKGKVFLFNTLSKRKELFKPITPDHVGLYVCGPTVYGEPHLGHARPAVTFDVVFRYLTHIGSWNPWRWRNTTWTATTRPWMRSM